MMFNEKQGFTLIELSLVLVIIGLIVGGVLVGRDLVAAAAIRAQITQLERYTQAVNTFRVKYGVLPGDTDNATTSTFGFTISASRTGTPGRGDANGLLEGYNYHDNVFSAQALTGETALFWVDLSSNAHLIAEKFTVGQDAAYGQNFFAAQIFLWLPSAIIGQGNYVDVYSAGGVNYYSISTINQINATGAGYGGYGLTVLQAAAFDTKIDDGLPTTGGVQANYLNGPVTASPNAASDTTSTCYNTAGPAYSITVNGGGGVNCALSFRFH